ncbi:protein wech-like [Haliotis rufescens]|uniref:protein wech-like n=1 Tax=Haliotis rufescens TaxID=6454 RepID=UPI00201E7B21|nr:protein wech-like [Haliotis rufescens]XP_048253850.1 protein wech-like [Haliotis rufescens]
MATSQKLKEHFLTCTICTEVFDNPCTLVCYHTFCRKCVVNYTKTRPEAISAKSLLCPFCSKMTKVSAPERPVEEWADGVKPSFVIQGLLDSFGPGSRGTTYCTCCHAEGETTPATVWCAICDESLCHRCARMHTRFPSTRHHDVLDLSGEVNISRKRNVMCNEHKEECIKFLCKDCKKVTCQICCVIYHRKCDSVVTLESELPALKSQLLTEKENILKKQILMETRVDTVKSSFSTEKNRYAQIESDIKSSGNKAREKITLKENKLLDELKEVSEKHIGQMTDDIKSGEISVQMYRQQAELIDQTLRSECDMDVYEMYQGCEAGDVEAVGDADLKEKGRLARIMFKQDTDKLSRALDDLQLGEIVVLFEGVLDLKGSPVLQDSINVLDLTVTPVLRDTINVTVAGDVNESRPIDVITLVINDTDTVVTTDWNNNSVKSFYTRDNQSCHSKLSLDSTPWSLTNLQHNQVAVTVHNNTIVMVQVNPDLVMLSTIATSKQYCGITSLTPSTLAASSQSPPCVDILDMTGNVLRSISPLSGGEKILQSPFFLCTTGTGNILVTDYNCMCVLCLTTEGDVTFTYLTSRTSPLGITSTSTGDILFADSQDNVVHLTKTGQFVRNILTADGSVRSPYGVCVDGCDHVYVCNYFSDEIKVFTCSDTA